MVTVDKSTLRIKLSANYTSAFNWQQRRHEDWKDNYELYRDKVIINRLTQRQSVNVPLMKETVKTILAHIADMPLIGFESLSNNKQGEIYLNEYWNYFAETDRLELKDVVDKKQVLLYGISSKRLLLENHRICSEVLDPHDVLFDRYADPTDIDATAQHIIVQHIYATLKSIETNTFYDKATIASLKTFFATEAGLIKAADTARSAQEKNQRMADMGVPDVDNPAVGEIIVELTHHYVKLWNDAGYYEMYLVVKAAGAGEDDILLFDSLENIIGETPDHYWRNHFPVITWSDDIERTDIYPDGVGDIVRTPNKVANVWISQLVENRTLRGLGMNFYDKTANEGFVPQTFTPIPWGWYPLPGKPSEIIQHVEIPDLSDSLADLGFVINMVERATAANAQEKGALTPGKTTLGEIQLVTQKAMERITAMSKFYRIANNEFAYKWYKMVEANADYLEEVKLYKKSVKGNIFEKSVAPSNWKDAIGYRVKVISRADQEQEAIKEIQKLQFISSQFPENVPLKRIFQKKALDLANLSPEEQKEVLDFEKQAAEAASRVSTLTPGSTPTPMQIPTRTTVAAAPMR